MKKAVIIIRDTIHGINTYDALKLFGAYYQSSEIMFDFERNFDEQLSKFENEHKENISHFFSPKYEIYLVE